MEPRSAEPATGALIDELVVGRIRVAVRYGCARRDQYELDVGRALPFGLRAQLAALPGATDKGTELLYVVELAGIHQITVASSRGRIVVMPRLSTERPAQRKAVIALCHLIDATL